MFHSEMTVIKFMKNEKSSCMVWHYIAMRTMRCEILKFKCQKGFWIWLPKVPVGLTKIRQSVRQNVMKTADDYDDELL